MRNLAIRFPITDGVLVGILTASISTNFASGLKVQRQLPAGSSGDPFTRRMVTVRNDGGPDDGIQSRRRYGINVWADSSVDAENMCLDGMAGLRKSANGSPVTLVDQLSGPYEIPDDVPLLVAGKPLAHFYFTARVSVRGVNA